MSTAIYRKYRPQSFSDVTNQNHVKITIKNQIASKTVSHAYLFAGPRGVGKTTMARLLAKSLNCENRKDGEDEPCLTCHNCTEMRDGHALDVIEVDAASNTGVDNVRDNIIEAVRFSPGKGRHKIFIIDEAHMLSTPAFNALLKTLEEPPAHAIFVLATTEVHKIPQTILSRCQRFDFHRLATSDIKARLKMISRGEGVKVADEVIDAVTRLSEGCLRDAESLLGQVFALGEKEIGVDEASIILPVTNTEIVLEIVDGIQRKDLKTVFTTLNTFVDQGGSIKNLIDELIDFVRNTMLLELGGPYHDHYDEKTMEKMRRFGESIGPANSATLLDKMLDARSKPHFDAIVQLPLEIAIVEYCGVEGTPTSNIKLQNQTSTPALTPIPDQTSTLTQTPIQTPISDSTPKSEGTISLEEIQLKWGRCCEAVGKRNVALPMVLQKIKPTNISGDEVEISFDMQFHFDTINEPKNLKILEDAVSEVMQRTIKIKPIYAKAEQDEALGEIADAFGGQVI